MEKPTPKRQLAITFVDKNARTIVFYAVPDIVEDIRASGLGTFNDHAQAIDAGGGYWFSVNPLYDLDDVLKWIKALDPESEQ